MEKKSLIYFLIITISINAESLFKADPDFISTGYKFNGTPSVMIGDLFTLNGFTLSALIHIRNEKRFNQNVFPNHNWRGFASASYLIFRDKSGLVKSSFYAGLEHESAHATMGIKEEETRCYEKIYDGQYRRYMLNSALLSWRGSFKTDNTLSFLKIDYQIYFYSKNTPELAGKTTAASSGPSIGYEFRIPLKKASVFLSLFDRYIFKSRKKETGEIYFNKSDGEISSETRSWNIINSINTISIRAGLSLPVFDTDREINIYTGYIFGNIFGYVDSREKKSIFSVGVDFSRTYPAD